MEKWVINRRQGWKKHWSRECNEQAINTTEPRLAPWPALEFRGQQLAAVHWHAQLIVSKWDFPRSVDPAERLSVSRPRRADRAQIPPDDGLIVRRFITDSPLTFTIYTKSTRDKNLQLALKYTLIHTVQKLPNKIEWLNSKFVQKLYNVTTCFDSI